jgi:hypothetical protein
MSLPRGRRGLDGYPIRQPVGGRQSGSQSVGAIAALANLSEVIVRGYARRT